MKRLTETALFRSLGSGEALKLTETQLKTLYDDFVRSVIAISTETKGNTPPYFTIHYTRLELECMLSAANYLWAGEKYSARILFA